MLYIKNGKVRDSSRIVIKSDKYITVNPTEKMILADGWVLYEPVPYVPVETKDDQLQDLLIEQYNQRTDISDEDALKRPLLVYPWSDYINKSLKKGQIVSYDDKLWRVRQDILAVLETQSPDMSTASLYEVIEVEASGTIDDPIGYNPPMEIFNGKYYVQDGVKYKCTRDSGQALNNNLSELVGTYVEIANDESGDTGTTTEELGVINNPIQYVPVTAPGTGTPLEVGKYYIQNGIKYLCIKELASPTADLSAYVNLLYVSVVE